MGGRFCTNEQVTVVVRDCLVKAERGSVFLFQYGISEVLGR